MSSINYLCSHDRVFFDLDKGTKQCQDCLKEFDIEWWGPEESKPTKEEPCYHSYKEYIGFTHKYMYCTKCDHKLTEYLGK